jgi:cytochrome oxidase Cu insertion factor (SCO1/SenC/PrrC family)
MLKKIASILLVACLILGFVAGCSTMETNQTSLNYGNRIGDMAYDFSLPDLNGNTVTLSAFRGHVVVVNFWATS